MNISVIHPGTLSLLQDSGRFGQNHLGLTNGGPVDPEAFYWANRLCDNNTGATAIETTLGGLKLQSNGCTRVAITGADMPLTLNSNPVPRWQTLQLQAGDTLEFGYSRRGCRAYVAVSGGFLTATQFGSTATVVREGIGGLNGTPLRAGDSLPCTEDMRPQKHTLAPANQPQYSRHVTLRLMLGYQHQHFEQAQQRAFFQTVFQVSDRCDRMGYQLRGPKIISDIEGVLSEGIALGAVQIPPDGHPIVLLNDRQTIGGYPKIGTVVSPDLGRLAQLMPGDKVSFAHVDLDLVTKILQMHHNRLQSTPLQTLVT